MLTVKNQVKLTRVTNIAATFIGLLTPTLSELNLKAISRIACTIAQDNTHPLNCHFTIMHYTPLSTSLQNVFPLADNKV